MRPVYQAPDGLEVPLGKKKILAIAVGSDNQSDYHAYAADVYGDIPFGRGNAMDAHVDWFHYDGERRLPAVLRQNLYVFEAGPYVSAVKVQPFFQYQRQEFSDAVNDPKNNDRYQGGIHYYISGLNLKLTGAYTRLVPKASGAASTNEFTIQLQVFYF